MKRPPPKSSVNISGGRDDARAHPGRLSHPRRRNFIAGQRGSAAVTVALCMVLLVGIMAFTLDTGFLITRHSRCQQAVEAAAAAGALTLTGDDSASEARRIAVANGCPDSEALIVQPGFYDEWNDYEDFSPLTDFQADPDSGTPSVNEAVSKNSDGHYHYNNAVLVAVTETTDGLTGGLSGRDLPISAVAVAYLRRYGMLALGEDGIQTTGRWAAGYPSFQDNILHTNASIHFNGTESFGGDTRVSAVEVIEGGDGTTGVDPVEIPPIDWDALEATASEQGTLYHPAQWPEGEPANDEWHTDGRGNQFIRDQANYFFLPAPEVDDHNGAVYYFILEDTASSAGKLIISDDYHPDNHPNIHAYNFAIAAEMPIKLGSISGLNVGADRLVLGEPGERVVRIFSRGEIDFQDRSGGWNQPASYRCNGVLMRSEKKVTICPRMMSPAPGNITLHRVCIIADAIEITNVSYGSGGAVVLDGLFSSPSPPSIVRLGRLTAAE